MKKFKFLLVLVLITSFVVGCGSNSSKETSKEKTKETTKKKEKVKLLNDKNYYIKLAHYMDHMHIVISTGEDYHFEDADKISNEQIDHYIDSYIYYHWDDIYNIEQYFNKETNKREIPMSIRNDICKMFFNKDYYKGSEGTFSLSPVGGVYPYTWEVEDPILQEDGTILIKSTLYDEYKNVQDTNTLCIKEINKDQFRIIYVKY